MKNDAIVARVETLVSRLESMFESALPEPDWGYIAYYWRPKTGLTGVQYPHQVELSDILCIERQKAEVRRNTEQFVMGRSANNVLLSGSRGTGKSSLIKAILSEFSDQGLRLIEVEPQDLVTLPDIVELIRGRKERFIIYCDDLSFDAEDSSYKALKATLDGSISAPPDNLLIYATSNRRHLLPEYKQENQDARVVDGEIHHSEGVEEKISLSERFGLWLTFYPYSQDQYLEIVDHWLAQLDSETTAEENIRLESLKWALHRGSRSGRVAWQFARDWAGRIN